jgi:hypothetical protein
MDGLLEELREAEESESQNAGREIEAPKDGVQISS